MPTPVPPTVLIIGGGFAGRAALHYVKSHLTSVDLILVDNKPFFEYTPSILRCIVQPPHLRTITTSHRGHNFTFLCGHLTHLTAQEAIVKQRDSDREYETAVVFDYCIVATGVSFSSPIHSDIPRGVPTVERRTAELVACQESIAKAKHILIVGAGPIGVELAAELTTLTKGTDKVLAIATPHHLLQRLPSRAGEYASRWLQKRGVKVVCARLRPAGILSDGCREYVDEKSDLKIVTDLVFDCTGAKSNGSANALLSGGLINPQQANHDGSITVLPTLQISNAPHIFVAGDVSRVPGELDLSQLACEKTAYAAEEAGTLAGRNVVSLINGDVVNRESQTLKQYPWDVFPVGMFPRLFVVSLYKYNSILCVGPVVVTGFLPAIIKAFLEFCSMRGARGNDMARSLLKLIEVMSYYLVALLTMLTRSFRSVMGKLLAPIHRASD